MDPVADGGGASDDYYCAGPGSVPAQVLFSVQEDHAVFDEDHEGEVGAHVEHPGVDGNFAVADVCGYDEKPYPYYQVPGIEVCASAGDEQPSDVKKGDEKDRSQ